VLAHLVLAPDTGKDASTQSLNAANTETANQTADTDVWQHGPVPILRCHPCGQNDGGQNRDRSPREKTRGEEQLLEVRDVRDALFFWSIQSKDRSPKNTLDGPDPTEEGKLLLEDEVGQDGGYHDGQCAHRSLSGCEFVAPRLRKTVNPRTTTMASTNA
jgi:hypothetical protein